jgi:ABC-2 type transport system ATP-binding protein
MISVSELCKRYGSFVAVDRLSFEVARGEVVGFLGPNGAGKTTTLRMLTGYHPASSGTAVLAGHDVGKDSLAVRQSLGYLPQEVPIYPDLRVGEYLRYRAALKRIPARERRQAVSRAMDKAGLHDVARKLCGHVSHGYRQRVGLADALLANPPILILDEPTSGLDPNQRIRIKQVVRELASEHTILFSSHILGEVQEVSSRVLIIHRGQLRAEGSPAQLLAQGVGSTLHVGVLGDAPALAAVLDGIRGITRVTAEGPLEGSSRARCELAAGCDPSIELAKKLLAAGLPTTELRIERPSLEDFFHRLTRDESVPAAAAEPVAAGGGS